MKWAWQWILGSKWKVLSWIFWGSILWFRLWVPRNLFFNLFSGRHTFKKLVCVFWSRWEVWSLSGRRSKPVKNAQWSKIYIGVIVFTIQVNSDIAKNLRESMTRMVTRDDGEPRYLLFYRVYDEIFINDGKNYLYIILNRNCNFAGG